MPELALDLARYFERLEAADYALVKLPEHFPRMRRGEDLDLLTPDKEAVARELLAAANEDVKNGFEVRVTYGAAQQYIHLDLFEKDELQLRFDIASALSSFGAYRVKPGFVEQIVERRQEFSVPNGGRSISVHVPEQRDELIVRYLEYHELFASRPDKIKHLEYIERVLDGSPERRDFLDRLHANIALPHLADGEETDERFVTRLSRVARRGAGLIRRAVRR